MVIEQIGETEIKIKGIGLIDFFDDRFIGLLKKQLPDIDFQHFCMLIVDKESKKIKEKYDLSHDTMDDNINKILTVSVIHTESMNKIMKVMEEYNKEKC